MDYIPVLVLMLVGMGVGTAVLILTHFLGKSTHNPRKDTPFECGVPGVGHEKHRHSVRFYLVAILFLLFDVEVIFFYPWAVVYRKYLAINHFILFEMAIFVGILLVGYYYVLRKGALEWE